MFVDELLNKTTTQNGAVTHKSSLNACLDLFSMGVSGNKALLIEAALKEDPITAIKAVLYLRDCRGGQGNKDIAREFHKVVIQKLATWEAFMTGYIKLLPFLPELGSWKDIYDLYGRNAMMNNEILKLVTQAIKDNNGLAAKWFPRQSQFHKDYCEYVGKDLGTVRRQITKLTKVVETKMCSQNWHEINYSQVPSVANKKYNKAFKRNDSSRYEQFLNKAVAGEVKVNAAQLYPHEITYKAKRGGTESKQADALWKNLPNYMADNQTNILPVIDTSGSMTSTAYSPYSCMDIAIGLGLYFSEHNTGEFKDVWCNFDTNPKFKKLTGSTLSERVRTLDYNNWGGSTNIQAVFDTILPIAIRNPETCPKAIIIVSDIEFNEANRRGMTNFEAIKDKYAAAGLVAPTVIFWRVNVKVSQQPVTAHSTGAVLINGFSPAIMKLLCSFDLETLTDITPLSLMHKALEKYKFVNELFVA
jgi:hypothetical protein